MELAIVEHAGRAKVELKVKGWTKNKAEGSGLPSDRQSHRPPRRRRGDSQSQGEKKNRFKTACSERSRTIYFPKALQGHLKKYLKVKTKRGESLLLEAPLFVSRNSAKGHPAVGGAIAKAKR